MIWLLLVILLIVAIVATSRSGKKNKVETEKLETELQNLKSTPSSQQTTVSVPDELIKLKSLLDTGVITQDEFDTQKKKILSN